MVRTKADAGSSKVSVAKAPRKVFGSSGSGSAGSSNSPHRSSCSSKDRYSGGNPYNPQPKPTWQKGIGSFFKPGADNKDKMNKSTSNDDEVMECPESTPTTEQSADKSPSKQSADKSPSKQSVNKSPSKQSADKSPSKQSSVSSSEDTVDDVEEKSFTKNGIISDDEDE